MPERRRDRAPPAGPELSERPNGDPYMLASVGIGIVFCLGVLAALTAAVPEQQPPAPSTAADATTRIVASAQALLTTLDEPGRTKVQFPFDGPQKTRWSNFPSPMFQREGLRLGDLTPAQRTAVNNLLAVALSPDGYRKVTEIMRGDEVLRTRRPAQRRVFPHPEPNPRDRVRAAKKRRPHPYQLPRSDQRLRWKVHAEVAVLLVLACGVFTPRQDVALEVREAECRQRAPSEQESP